MPVSLQDDSDGAEFDGLQVLCCGLTPRLVEEATRRHDWPVRLVEELPQADVVLSVRQGMGQQPSLRRQAREARVPILVIKSDTLAQVERALERLLSSRRGDGKADPASSEDRDDALAALEECRLAVEQVVVPLGRPVELLPRTEEVRRCRPIWWSAIACVAMCSARPISVGCGSSRPDSSVARFAAMD